MGGITFVSWFFLMCVFFFRKIIISTYYFIISIFYISFLANWHLLLKCACFSAPFFSRSGLTIKQQLLHIRKNPNCLRHRRIPRGGFLQALKLSLCRYKVIVAYYVVKNFKFSLLFITTIMQFLLLLFRFFFALR